jgi:hypothetical protein
LTTTRLLLTTGELLVVEGASRDVEKRLQNAARSSPGTLAWMNEEGTGEDIAVNPSHVVTLRSDEEAAPPAPGTPT